jgi:hypothetical protein
MSAVVFYTPGLIDIRSFTTFGVNAKPNTTNPIGYFGTGLKYATAVIVRNGLKMTVWIGDRQYTFYKKATKFRDTEFDFVRMKEETHNLGSLMKGNPKYHELPFITELGKNWELWQAFRELETNTQDEGGKTFTVDFDPHTTEKREDLTSTYIMVEGAAFLREFEEKDKTFLNGDLTVRESSYVLDVLEKPSKYVYYRGMRVLDVDKPMLHTYNLKGSVSLTEDRTLASQVSLEMAVGEYIATTCEDEDLIREIITAPKNTWEGSLRWEYTYLSPSPLFLKVAAQCKQHLTPSVGRYYGGYAPTTPQKYNPLDKHPRPWTISREPDMERVTDKNGGLVFTAQTPEYDVLNEIVDYINKNNANP